MAQGGPTGNAIVGLALTLQMLRPNDDQIVVHNQPDEKQHRKGIQYQHEAIKAQQQQEHQKHRKVKAEKPTHFGKSSTPISKYKK